MNSLDANVVLRFLLNDLPAQSAKARRLITDSQCYVSDVILTEVVFVLEKVRGLRRPDIAVLLKRLISLENVVCNQAILERAIDLFTRTNQLSFPDCYLAIEALLSNDTVMSFDKGLLRHGGNHIKEP